MATKRTRNLKLYITDTLSAEAKANLEIIDSIGGIFVLDPNDVAFIRSKESIQFTANDASIGGTGVGGEIYFGTASQILDKIVFYTASFKLSDALTLADKATGSTGELKIKYKSDILGALDNLARTLYFDVQGADRNIVLGGNFITSGGHNLTLVTSADTSVTLPTSGTLATLSNPETLTNKTIDATNNTILNIANANIATAAAIAGTKITPDFGSQNVITSGQLRLRQGTNYVSLEAPTLSSSTSWKLPPTDGISNQVLKTDGSGNLGWMSIASANQMFVTWSNSDGTTKTVTHGWGTKRIIVQVYDHNDETVYVDVDRPTVNTVVLTSSSAPTSNWTVLLYALE